MSVVRFVPIVLGVPPTSGAPKTFGRTAPMWTFLFTRLWVTGRATFIMLFPEVEQVVRFTRLLLVVMSVAPMTVLCLLLLSGLRLSTFPVDPVT